MCKKIFRKAFIGGEWSVCIRNKSEAQYTLIENPKGFWVADPFIVEKEHRLFLFGEFYSKKENLGKIASCEIVDGKMVNIHFLINSTTHMSYPFYFEHKGNSYLLPENSQYGSLPLFLLDKTMTKATFVRDILGDTDFVDSSLCVEGQHYWVIGYSEKRKQLGYFSLGDDLLPISPIFWREKDLTDRPAGAGDGSSLKPFQNNKKKYGESIIEKQLDFSASVLREKCVSEITPKDIQIKNYTKKPDKTHTLNSSENFIVVDVFFEKLDLFRWAKMIQRKGHQKQKRSDHK